MALEMSKLRAMSVEDLDREEGELREEIWKLRLQRSSGQLQDRHRVSGRRHDLARILTVKTEKARAAKAGESGR
jgi:large subunit ribosomal protein L29